jgi:glycosyltransferase involved in cell wall biosynthesis
VIFNEIKDRVKWLPWHSDINTYPLSLRELSGDIAICPLTDDIFNNGKSPLKWEEMSAMKVPCVCSPTVYGNFIEHGKTGFIARQGEWEACLEKLLDPDLRQQIGQNAYNSVKREFSLNNATMYWSALQDLLK